jgi:hypothetical protein
MAITEDKGKTRTWVVASNNNRDLLVKVETHLQEWVLVKSDHNSHQSKGHLAKAK